MTANNSLKVWLEDICKRLLTARPGEIETAAFAIITDEGTVETAYFGQSMIDKITIAGVIQQDAMLQTLAANEEDEE